MSTGFVIFHLTQVSPQDGVCQVAVVLLVAVNICPEEGAVALLTLTVVVADLRAFVLALFPDVS